MSILKGQIKRHDNGTALTDTILYPETIEDVVQKFDSFDNSAYLLKATPTDKVKGSYERLNKLVGGTIAWNQLVQNGNFTNGKQNWYTPTGSTVASGILSFIAPSQWGGILQEIKIPQGHRVLLSLKIKTTTASRSVQVTLQHSGGTAMQIYAESTTEWQILEVVSYIDGGDTINLQVKDGRAKNRDEIYVTDIQCFDLTQMFGSTIANYIYSLEQANAGAGVAWFKELFPKPYYEYNAGELVSVKTSAHETVGFNQWDEASLAEFGFTKSGEYWTRQGHLYSYPYIWENKSKYAGQIYFQFTGYYTNGSEFNVRIKYTDGSQTVISTTTSSAKHERLSASGKIVEGIDFDTSGAPNIYIKDACINFSHSGYRNGEYEPYVKQTYALDSDLELCGIPKLDSNNKLYYDGDEYESDGTVTRRYGIVDLGTLNWIPQNDSETARTNGIFQGSNLSPISAGITGRIANAACSKYPIVVYRASTTPSSNKGIGIYGRYVSAEADELKNKTNAEVKAAMSGIYLVYELTTHTTETADPYKATEKVDAYGTESFIDYRPVPMPVYTETNYLSDLSSSLYEEFDIQNHLTHNLPIVSKTYPAYTITANDTNNGYLYFGTVDINDKSNFYKPWGVHYRVTVNTTTAQCNGTYDVFYGVNGTTINYSIFNNFYSSSYYPIYYHLLLYPKSATYINKQAHFGIRIQSAYLPTTLAREIKVEVLECFGCTVTLKDNIVLYKDLYNSTYFTSGTYNATSVGLQETGDSEAGQYYLRYSSTKAQTAITAGKLIVGSDSGYSHLSPSVAFDLKYPILYAPSAISAGNTGQNYKFHYAINLTTTQSITLTAYKAVYLVGTLNGTMFTPDTTMFTQTIPTTVNNKVYKYIGHAYNTTNISFDATDDRLYAFYNEKFQEIVNVALTIKTNTGVSQSGTIPVIGSQGEVYTYATATGSFDSAGALTLSGIKVPKVDLISSPIIDGPHRDNYYASNLCRHFSTNTPNQFVVKTKIKYVSGKHMPLIRIYGYAYGLNSPIELRIGFYIYGGELGWSGVSCTGAWKPDVFLFKYTESSVDYVALGLKGSCYFCGFQVDAQIGASGSFGSSFSIDGWSTSHNGADTSVSLIPAVGTDNCIQVPYKAMATDITGNATTATKLTDTAGSVTQPIYINNGVPTSCTYSLNATVPADAKFTDTWKPNTANQEGYVAASIGATNQYWGTDDNGDPGWRGLPTASTTVAGITKVGASGGAAAYSHTHSYVPTSRTINGIPLSSNVSLYKLVTHGDNRSTNTTPNDYANVLSFEGLKNNSTIGITSEGVPTYSYLVGLRGWSDSSGGNAWELAFNNKGINVRNGATTTWGAWDKLLTESRTINGKALSDNVTLYGNDIKADDNPASITLNDWISNVQSSIPTIPNITIATATGSGSIISGLSASGHTITPAKSNLSTIINNDLSTGTSTPVDADYFISQYVNGGTSNTTYYRRPISTLWTYIKSKADNVYIPTYHYYTTVDLASGWYKIKINATNSWMLAFTIRLYQNYTWNDIIISGYNYGTNYWYSPTARLMGDSDSIEVKFGYDSTWNLWVAVPRNRYTGLDIFNVTNGYMQVTDKTNLFTITSVDTLTGTTQSSLTLNNKYATYSHTHTISQITDFPTDLVTSYTPTAQVQNIAVFGASGTLIGDSGVNISDVITSSTITPYLTNQKVNTDNVSDFGNTSTITLKAGSNVTVTGDNTNKTITITATNTKNTAGSTNTSNKIFLVGATSQDDNPQTYSHDTAYVGTDGCLYSGGAKVLTSHQSLSGYVRTSRTINAKQLDNDVILYGSDIKADDNPASITLNDWISNIQSSIPTIPSNNITGSGTSGYIAKFNGTYTITNGPAFGSSTTTYLRNDGSWATPPNSDTKNTAGSTDTSSKIFLIGAISQAANPQTYSHDTAYVGTDGCLYSGGAKVLTSHQSLSGYVPTSRKINNVPLTNDVNLTAMDITMDGTVGGTTIYDAYDSKQDKITAGTGLSFNGNTLNHSNSITAVTTAGLYKIKYDAQGHITGTTAVAKADITALGIPGSDTDTKNTAGSTNTTSKIFLIGATSQAANPQTYSNSNVFVTNGEVTANSYKVTTNATISYNTTSGCLEIIC